MPKTRISEFDVVAANNTDINGIDIAEGCAPSGINNAIRTLMSDLKDLQAGTSGDTIPIAAGGTGATTASAARIALGAGIGDVTTTGTQTLTNKTISADNNTLSGIANSSFVLSNASGNIDGSAAQKVIPAGVVVGTTDTQVLTNKTIDGASNTLTNLPIANITEPNLPAIRPSLNLDFANTKQLDPRITFTRASTGTFYNGVTTAKAEENLLVQSQNFTTTWLNSNTTDSANTANAPDGTATADTLTPMSISSVKGVEQFNISVSTGLPYSYSIFVKANGNNFVQLYFGNTGFGLTQFANFNITSGTGAVGTVGANATATITSVGNDWYRCTITATSTATTAESLAGIAIISSSTAVRRESWATTGTEQLFLWGAQLEQRSAVTAYTVTTTQPITNYVPVLQTAQNNVARFDHNPITGESLGLEIEEQRTNLFIYSEDWSNAAWTKTRGSVNANSIISPSGTQTADTFVEDSATGNHFVSQDVTVVAAGTYTSSVYLKAAGRRYVQLFMDENNLANNVYAYFDLQTGTITQAAQVSGVTTLPASSITSVGNGWYRCTVTAKFNSASTTGRLFVLPTNVATGAALASIAGSNYESYFIWGAQLEAGAFPTSYIPTVASQVTRSADSAVMTGTNFSSWFNNAEGSLFVDYVLGQKTTNVGLAGFDFAGSPNDVIQMRYGSTGLQQGLVNTNGVNQAALGATGYTAQGSYKAALFYSTNSFQRAINGLLPNTEDTSVILPSLANFRIGNEVGSTNFINGTIKKLAYYPLRISNAQLQALTGL